MKNKKKEFSRDEACQAINQIANRFIDDYPMLSACLYVICGSFIVETEGHLFAKALKPFVEEQINKMKEVLE